MQYLSQMNQFMKQAFRALMAIVVCTLLLFSTAVPALAARNMPSSQPTEGEAQLKDIYEKSEEALQSGQRSMGEVQSRAQKGPNEVQSSADMDEMHYPATPSEGESVGAAAMKKVLDKATGND